MRRALIGREAELREADVALECAAAGRGTTLLITGEAGIGKSRLLDAFAELGRHRGFTIAWGRAWEAGGAPSFWPWMQVFRELEEPWPAAPSGTLGREARFEQYDRLASALAVAAQGAPLLVLLDDLHAADEASWQLLLFAAQRLASDRVVIAATARDAEVDREAFARIARHARSLGLGRLSLEEVTALAGDPGLAAAIHARSEGLPLFVEELLDTGAASLDSPRIGAVLDVHLGRLSEETRVVLERASVVGRSFALDAVVVDPRERDATARAIALATEARVLVPEPDRGHRFAHVLLRDRVYDAMDVSARQAHHDRLGAARADAGELSVAAHHLLRGARLDAERVARVTLAAARRELDELGFERALGLATEGASLLATSHPLQFDLSLLRAEALAAGGEIHEGREEAARAYERASDASDADGMARAALLFGREVFTGRADPRLALMLEQALGAGASPEWTSRLMARLAAARIPPRSHDEARWAVSTAHEAIVLARSVRAPTVLLETLRHAASACGYIVSRAEQIALAEETLDVARALDRLDYVAEVAGFVHAIRAEAGRADARAALAELEHSVERLGRHQRWRLAAARATASLFDGHLADAREHADELARWAEVVVAPGARVASVALELGLMTIADPHRELPPHVDFAGYPALGLFRPWILAARGQRDEARSAARALVNGPAGFPQHVMAGAACVQLGDTELAALIRPQLARHVGVIESFFGPGGVYCAGPVSWIVADLHHLEGDEIAARAGYERALGLATTWGFIPLIAILRERLGARSTPPPTPPTARLLRLEREGELWLLHAGDERIGHVPDVKGMAYLARLLSEPGRDLHVLELVGAEHRLGDAGVLLDARAVSEYRARMADLRATMEEAEAWSDLGRRDAARSELESLQTELARALGLGGRTRLAGSQLERARINVQRRVRDAVRRIARLDAAAGEQLGRCLRTGTTCCYRP